MQPLILTLLMDDASFEILDGLRREHFPPKLNRLRAHVTLFHHLPGEREAEIREALTSLAARVTAFPMKLPAVRFLGKGVAIDVDAKPLLDIRRAIAELFSDDLTPQDAQKWRPHVTVQNKVDASVARQLFERMSRDWRSETGVARGLILHRYLGGPWEEIGRFAFV